MRFVIFQILSQFEFLSFVTIWVLEYGYNFSFATFWVLNLFLHHLSFVTIWVLSQLKFCHNLRFFTIWIFEFGHNLCFWVLSQFELLSLSPFEFSSFVTIWVLEFHNNFSFWISSQFELLSFITIWFFSVSSQFEFLSYITIWVFELHTALSCWVSPQCELFFISGLPVTCSLHSSKEWSQPGGTSHRTQGTLGSSPDLARLQAPARYKQSPSLATFIFHLCQIDIWHWHLN